MSEKQDYLICTSFNFGGRDIGVVVRHDGFSYWTDRTSAGSVLDSQFRWRSDEHTIQAPVSDNVFTKIRDELSPAFWNDVPIADEILDPLLEPIFWEHVAVYFSISRDA